MDQVYDDISAEMKSEIENKETLVICQDGWSSVQNDLIVAHSFHDGKKSYLHYVVDSGPEKKTADYCFKIINEAIVEIKESYGKSVFAVCTDNEAKMTKMRQTIQTEYPGMLTYECNAHYMSLLEKDVNNSSVLKHVVKVQKYFRNVHMAHGLLKEKGGCMPQLPNETCWNSQVACLETYKRNHNLYMEIRGEKMPEFHQTLGKSLTTSVSFARLVIF